VEITWEMNKPRIFKEIEESDHYFVPEAFRSRNVEQRDGLRWKPVSVKNLTFNQLIAIRKQRMDAPGMAAPSSIPNECSALMAFVRERGIAPDSPIGSTLRLSYYKWRNKHLATLSQQGMPAKQLANRKTLLKRWHLLINALDREEAHATGADTPFQARCKEIFSKGGAAVKPTAKALGIAPSTIFAWLRGGSPRADSYPVIAKLEQRLGLIEGELTALLAKPDPTSRPRSSTADSTEKVLTC
jgi:hypothetical protein